MACVVAGAAVAFTDTGPPVADQVQAYANSIAAQNTDTTPIDLNVANMPIIAPSKFTAGANDNGMAFAYKYMANTNEGASSIWTADYAAIIGRVSGPMDLVLAATDTRIDHSAPGDVSAHGTANFLYGRNDRPKSNGQRSNATLDDVNLTGSDRPGGLPLHYTRVMRV